ncbi:ArgS-related anticodon-binding protein NrtL [Streptomyces griseorubiginosus]|uniref:ArgS-related anticodon-binding protein NrtL n=1 Tax=Streptomyces griseorubiginosus TaxID=67304 RepID=UPI00339E05FC
MTPVELSRTVLRAVRRAVDDGELDVVVPGSAKVTAPGPGGCGDYATNLALQLAGPAGQPPLRVAEILRRRLADSDGISDVVVTGPGFLNFSLRGNQAALVREILRLGQRYGHADRPTGQLVQLHAPHEVRAVVVMDALARVLRSQGALVRTSCAGRPDPEWVRVLRADVDAYGTPDAPAPLDVNVRPVPADSDPTSLGRDAGRWALLHPAPHDRPRLTGDHLVQRESNPLFRVRYAHARTRALRRNASDLGFHAESGDTAPPGHPLAESGAPAPPARPLAESGAPAPPARPLAESGDTAPPGHPLAESGDTATPGHPLAESGDTAPPGHPLAESGDTATPGHPLAEPGDTATPGRPLAEPRNTRPARAAVEQTQDVADLKALHAVLADHPRVLARAAAHHAPDLLARHLVTVADAALPFLVTVLPRGAEKPSAAHRARLALAEAVGAVLAGGLTLLGIDAPEHL